MGSRYRFWNDDEKYFVTFTTVQWLDVFSRQCYRDALLESLRFCQTNKGLIICEYVIMTNHLHLIIGRKDSNTLSAIVRDFKKYTSQTIIESILQNGYETRRQHFIKVFGEFGAKNPNNKAFQFWQNGCYPILVNTKEKFMRMQNYIHQNPVKAGIVIDPSHYLYCSAGNTTKDGDTLIEIEPWS